MKIDTKIAARGPVVDPDVTASDVTASDVTASHPTSSRPTSSDVTSSGVTAYDVSAYDVSAYDVSAYDPAAGPMTHLPAHLPESEERTRDRVCRVVLQNGPVTAAQLATTLHLTPAAVRRHLDVLTGDGLVTTHEAPVLHRGRGRPARRFVLTAAGHAAMNTGYDDLAVDALTFLADVAGQDAVRQFAQARVADLESRYAAAVAAAGSSPTARAQALAVALTTDGYAASTRPVTVGSRRVALQLCQGHCPVQRVAAQFPQLCEAETEAFSRLLGAHVQRLATLAHGEHVCTTHVPDVPSTLQSTRPQERTSP